MIRDLTAQELFDRALFGIRGQGYARSVKNSVPSCRYRGENDRRCALGHAIDDDEYRPSMEGMSARDLLDGVATRSLGIGLQRAHDLTLKNGAALWEEEMARLADMHGLSYTPPDVDATALPAVHNHLRAAKAALGGDK